MSAVVSALLLALTAGSTVYCVLVIVAATRYRRWRPERASEFPPISILSPLAGMDEGLEAHLRSFFEEDYPEFEILFAARTESDPALGVARKLMAEYSRIPAGIVVTGEPPYPNAKVYSLHTLIRNARHDIVLMKDSDVRSRGGMLRTIAAEFQDKSVLLATCPYRAVAHGGLWWRLDAVGINTGFFAGVAVARMLGGMDFALGPAIAARKEAIAAIGGIGRFGNDLAEDFLLGNAVHRKAGGVILSSYSVDHYFGGGDWLGNLRHRLRWYRSSRRSRRLGYVGELFTYTLPLAAALAGVSAAAWPLAVAAVLLRGISGWCASEMVAGAPMAIRDWLALPADDFVRFAFWWAGFFGRRITWRGRQYVLRSDGRIGLPPDVPG